MSAVVDFHTHILPQVDDGSSSLDESLEMLRSEFEQGIRHVVLTPHFYARHDSPDRFLVRTQKAYDKLLCAVSNQPYLPSFSLGSEVYFFEGISDCEYLPQLAISGTKAVMIEMPGTPWSDRMLRELADIHQKMGLIPVIAHLDRYLSPFSTGKMLSRLKNLPVLIQVNSSFFLERRTQRLALKMLQQRKIHLVGSDCHNMRSRSPDLQSALTIIEKRLGNDPILRINETERGLFGADIIPF